ncbi:MULTISPECIES: hypothetical protein [unclassified Synechococcus]|uniref:hypothetical protein n=1 Tax=unclassified Synechococcus TaxID=2626047 RepID=UPI0012E9C19A|nr:MULTISPECIES: hypothetical protein [unclassified Synechococcus]WFN58685.1 hypothetical protein N4320_12940 [Synechococcus sp. CCFWC 502]
MASFVNKCKKIIFSDEYPSCWPINQWASYERQAITEADLIVVPDSNRFYGLAREVPLNTSHKHVQSLNLSAKIRSECNIPRERWHSLLGVPIGDKIILFFGGIGSHNMIDEILKTYDSWPLDYHLVIRGNSPFQRPFLDKLVSAHCQRKPICITHEIEPESLDQLITQSSCTLALYRDTGKNMTEMGLSSGKILRSVYLGTPVITSDFDSLKYVSSHGLGLCIPTTESLVASMHSIIGSQHDYQYSCLAFANKHLDISGSIVQCLDAVKNARPRCGGV